MSVARCVDFCLDQPLLGSASWSRWLLIVDQPRPWLSKIQHSLTLPPEWQAITDSWRENGEPFSLLARASDQGQIHLFRWQQGVVHQLTHPQAEPQSVRPRLLVCTHGSRDACCGSLGVRLAQILRSGHEVWEVSHLGGHRFAPTLWHLPSWRLYGRLPLDSSVVEAWNDSRYLRGNAAYSPQIQVLEEHLRRLRGQWPLWICEHENGFRVRWPSGPEEMWAARLLTHSHRGPLSCRDIAPGKSEPYLSYEVAESECVGLLS